MMGRAPSPPPRPVAPTARATTEPGARRPVIGISACLDEGRIHRAGTDYVYLSHAYVAAVEAAGGVPLVVPPSRDDGALDLLDGLVISGGDDIPPHYYGAVPVSGIVVESARRVESDLRLLAGAFERGVPVLGVCYGMQLLGVWRGGSLLQALPRAPVDHGVPGAPCTHPVAITPGSLLHRVCGTTSLQVRSSHRQAVAHLGAGCVATATAPDGVVEALEVAGDVPMLGVEWHPETGPDGPLIYAGLVAWARARATAPRGTPSRAASERPR